jgi:hypothetical protein
MSAYVALHIYLELACRGRFAIHLYLELACGVHSLEGTDNGYCRIKYFVMNDFS